MTRSKETILGEVAGEDQRIAELERALDEACWFLAADFDKGSWKADVAAFAETCRIVGVPVAIERSRSGNGAHAWFFFTAPVRANVARRMGCYLITETMSRRHELSMESY